MQLWVGPTLKQILPMLSPAELRRLAEAAEEWVGHSMNASVQGVVE